MERKAKEILRAINVALCFPNPVFQALFWYSMKGLDKVAPDLSDKANSKEEIKKHLDQAIGWFLNQQKQQKDHGIASRVSFSLGKTKIETSYPEVTGYIITTFCDYYELFKTEKVLKTAKEMADFELGQQYENGAFPGGTVGHSSGPSVFNSAQIINGLVRIYEVTHDKKYLEAANRATEWIASVQDEDGSWTKANYMGMKRVYDSKVDQSLLDVDRVLKTDKYRKVTKHNFDFIASQQQANGWFANCDNSKDKNETPLTHTIGYTIEGLISCYLMNNEKQVLEICQKAADVLLAKFEQEPHLLPGRFDKNWDIASKSSCMTGNAQIAMCWIKLYHVTRNEQYLTAAKGMINCLMNTQIVSKFANINGAVPSSYPFWGEYNAYTINSWGVKYFCDAMMLEYKNSI